MEVNEERIDISTAVNNNLNRSIGTRRTRNNNTVSCSSPMNETDQENVNNIMEETDIDQSLKDESFAKSTTSKKESKLQTSTTNINSSTPRRKKDPLANLHSNLSPKYIGFTTPTTPVDNSNSEERSRSLRRRNNITNTDTPNMSSGSPFTLNNDSTVGYVRRTPMGKDATPDNGTRKQEFVSPIDKLLKKNGSIVESNILPLEELRKNVVKKGDKEEEVIVNENIERHLDSDEKSKEVNENNCQTLEENEKTTLKDISIVEINETKITEEEEKQSETAEFTLDPNNVEMSTLEFLFNQDEPKVTLNPDEDIEVSSSQEEFISIKDETEVQSNCDEVASNDKENLEEMDNNSNQDENFDKNKISSEENKENSDVAEVESNDGLSKTMPNQNEMKCSSQANELDSITNHTEDLLTEAAEETKDKLENLNLIEETWPIKSVTESLNSSTKENNIEKSIVKIELDSVESESNNDFVDASTSAKSPSAISMDSAKGSSIVNEGSWVSFSTGDLYWGQIYNYCYWPCLVCPDPDGKTITTEENGRSGDQHIMVHVRFFADNGRRNWVKRDNLMPFMGVENYQERLEEAKEKHGVKSAKFKVYVPTKKKEQKWYEAVEEANIVAEVPYGDRLEKFYEIFEKSKAFLKLEKQRRKSLYLPSSNSGSISDAESFYGSHDNINTLTLPSVKQKRERSISPYSPVYSPVKRRKLSGEQNLPSTSAAATYKNEEQQQQNNELNLSQTNSVTSSTSNSLIDLEIFNGLDFKKFYTVMKDFVMEQNHNENLEKSLVVAVRNIWALKQLSRHQMERKLRESLTENEMYSDNIRQAGAEGSVKRLSTRLKTIMVRKSLLSQQPQEVTPDRSLVQKSTKENLTVDKVKRPLGLLNRPILEVIDDIFELDNKYLFKGMNRDPVCKYCFKPGGNLKRCAKNCNYWLHSECLHKDFSINGKTKRGIKRVSITKPNNDAIDGSSTSNAVIDVTTHDTTDINTVAHVTGDSEGDVVCKECSSNDPVKCMVCKCTESLKDDDPLIKCSMSQCDRSFHPACCKYWPQSKITISKNHIESFRCPSHVCHTCVSDDPKGKFQHLSNAKLTKCVKCPATFHTDSTCIPAGSQILTAANIICPRHTSQKHDMTVNVNWCFICVGGGQVVCCETCPTAVHAQCLKIPIAANEGYICEECESGRMPLYGEMVWAKFNNFRWWPAIILPPTEIPKNIAKKTHNPSDFVVRFFGTHDHGWISRRRVYLYLEGDSSEPPKSKSHLDLNYKRGVEEAKEVYEIIKDKKLQQRTSNENKEKLHPQPYVRIKANRAVPPVKLHVDIDSVSKCECDPYDENPCGPDTNCLNRVLYHECNPKICPAGERCQNQMFESRISPRVDVIYMKERGFGLVSREPIKAGTFIIEYVGEIINDNEFQARMQQKSRDRDENFYFLSVEKDYIIDAGPKGNLARFMNHSCDPNCETQKWSVNSLNRVGLFAIKDIPENTELSFNYHWDDLLGNEKKTCYCGSSKCAGQIGAKLKQIEPIKEPSTSGLGRNKSKTKIKTKTKPVKRLTKGLKGKPGKLLKLNVKTKTKKMAIVAAAAASLKANNSTPTSPTLNEDNTQDDQEASTSSRSLESPDLFE